MERGLVTELFIPASLVIIMLGMGLSLVPEDFRSLARHPRAVLTGLAAQLFMVPVVAWLVVLTIPTAPVLAVGLLVISSCPGGAVSNLIVHLARGNTALSISLTAISSMATVFTIPLLVNVAMKYFLGGADEFSLPILKTAFQLAAITIFPVIVGMSIRHHFTEFARRSERAVKTGSGLFLVLVILAAVYDKIDQIPGYLE